MATREKYICILSSKYPGIVITGTDIAEDKE